MVQSLLFYIIKFWKVLLFYFVFVTNLKTSRFIFEMVYFIITNVICVGTCIETWWIDAKPETHFGKLKQMTFYPTTYFQDLFKEHISMKYCAINWPSTLHQSYFCKFSKRLNSFKLPILIFICDAKLGIIGLANVKTEANNTW